MQITSREFESGKYAQIYLTEDELEEVKTKDIINKFKEDKNSIAIFVTGNENYPEILEKMITKQVEQNKLKS